jgi:hypothetical protein
LLQLCNPSAASLQLTLGANSEEFTLRLLNNGADRQHHYRIYAPPPLGYGSFVVGATTWTGISPSVSGATIVCRPTVSSPGTIMTGSSGMPFVAGMGVDGAEQPSGKATFGALQGAG